MFIVYPEYKSLKIWANTLVADNPTYFLPALHDENKWQEWGAAVAGTGIFKRYGVPPPYAIYKGNRKDNFKDWQQWAKVVCLLLNNGSQNKEF